MNALRSAWHPVVFSLALNTEPVAATLLDTPLVIWRDSNGTPHASSDICVHRGTALSGGCRITAGNLIRLALVCTFRNLKTRRAFHQKRKCLSTNALSAMEWCGLHSQHLDLKFRS